ncbi:NAD(+) synthase [Salinadaptatus halalkaliphilus]|uniref:NH(3)-dependent NAD(+) synthetase n=1 Tax=Salinadaptatus halalkaliphilus TaxID=2419781 RepID=A0A4V3VLK7_9EURY|nr:NAD(+) synthase [Salinadaptatus halalkaliphilus]THE66017.1 NAD(+) synthase [Salinadaptatus halalkaliphilus]
MTVSHTSEPASLPREDGLATTDEAQARLREQRPAFLEELVDDAGADRLVVGLDGSVETALAATFAVDAVGSERVTGLVMPAFLSHEAISRTAETVASALGIEHCRLQLQPVLAAFQEAVGDSSGPADDVVATNNALSRLRMTCAYYVANTTNALVVGTVDRTQYLLGGVTKHGETGADCLLFGDLYHSEVSELAGTVGIPDELTVETSGSPLYPGQLPIADFEIAPTTVDRVLRLRFDEGIDHETVVERTGVEPAILDQLEEYHAETEHKRRQPVTPSLRSHIN